MLKILKHRDAVIYIENLSNGKNKIRVKPINNNIYILTQSCETHYPIDMISKILDLVGPDSVCNEIIRDESPDFVQRSLKYAILGYVDEEEFKGKRLLDFGCGGGASTMILARMFPQTQIVGVELEERYLYIARLRAAHYGCANVELILSPNSNSLPQNIGKFDFVVLSGVFEHLLPSERKVLLPQIWSILKPGGILFVNQTPYRYFPIETHTTSGLPLINYLPDKIALAYAQCFSKRKYKNQNWDELLRKGIRGGTVSEIMGIINQNSNNSTLLRPSRLKIKDRIDLWYFESGNDQYVVLKKLILISTKLIRIITGVILVPRLSLAIMKVINN